LQQRRLLGLGLAVLLLAMGALGCTLVARLAAMQAADASSADLATSVQALYRRLVDAETGQRGYVLTGDPAYLAPYQKARTALGAEQSAVRWLVGDDPVAAALLARLRQLVAAKLAELAQTIKARDTAGEAAAVAIIRTGRGHALMGQIRAGLDALAARAHDRLRLQVERTRQTIRMLVVGVGAASLVALGLIALALTRAERAMRAQREAERFAAEKASSLQAALAHSPFGIAVFDAQGRLLEWNSRFRDLLALALPMRRGLTSSATGQMSGGRQLGVRSLRMARMTRVTSSDKVVVAGASRGVC